MVKEICCLQKREGAVLVGSNRLFIDRLFLFFSSIFYTIVYIRRSIMAGSTHCTAFSLLQTYFTASMFISRLIIIKWLSWLLIAGKKMNNMNDPNTMMFLRLLARGISFLKKQGQFLRCCKGKRGGGYHSMEVNLLINLNTFKACLNVYFNTEHAW